MQDAAAQYFDMMLKIVGRGSHLAQCLEMQRRSGWLADVRHKPVFSAGLEGTGHHLLSQLIISACPAHMQMVAYVHALNALIGTCIVCAAQVPPSPS